MKNMFGLLRLAAALWPAVVSSYALTDTLQDADPAQSGYLPNHNMDPNVVGSSSFGVLWSQTMTNGQENWFAKPLVNTMDGAEMVITASNMNNVRIHSAKNGTLLASRQLTPPSLRSDLGCADIPNFIGVTGTPIIDPATNIIYMFAKAYRGGAPSGGLANGTYQMYALQLPALQDVPGFPIMMDGNRADNNLSRYFIGGAVLQRPACVGITKRRDPSCVWWSLRPVQLYWICRSYQQSTWCWVLVLSGKLGTLF
ncbi:hypothetical protein B0H67DRAFT_30358 [Lasiosphaeris hirsuta]|uniref:Uncharacterized protein n=1 Tax=Lasiosphaeris hirsuta TaxID=260670 RepID=A0AA40BAF0_9PEZI|nr:hypothetical protein B0H67DRAFT_30358 [Lasiosphaeris hirsuta]